MKYFTALFLLCLTSTVLSQESWQEATKIADSLALERNYETAKNYREKAIALAKEQQKDTVAYLNLLLKIANSEVNFRDRNLFASSIDSISKYVTRLEEIGASPTRLGYEYRKLFSYSYNYLRDYKSSLDYVEKSVAYHKQAEPIDSLSYLNVLISAARIARDNKKFTVAEQRFEQAEDLYHKTAVKDPNELGALYLDKAYMYHSVYLNIPNKKFEYLLKAEEAFKQTDEPLLDYFFGVYMGLSDHAKYMGNVEEQIGFLNKGYQMYLKNKEKFDETRMLKLPYIKDLQYLQFSIEANAKKGDEAQMLSLLNKVETIYNNNELYAQELLFVQLSFLDTGTYFAEKGDLRAIPYLEKAEALEKELINKSYTGDIILAKGICYLENKQYDKAYTYLNQAKEKIPETFYLHKNALARLAQYYAETNNYEDFLATTHKLLQLIYRDPTITVENLEDTITAFSEDFEDANRIANVASYMKNHFADKQQLQKTLYWNALHQFNYTIENEPFNKKTKSIFHTIQNGILDASIPLSQAEIKNFVEISENIESKFSLQKYLQNRALASSNALKNKTFEEKKIRKSITALKKQLVIEPENEVLTQQLFEEEQKLKELEKNIAAINPELAKYMNPTFSLDQIDTKDKTVVQYITTNTSIFRITFSETTSAYKKIGAIAAIKSDIKKYLELLKNPQSSIETLDDSSKDLYRILLSDIPESSKITIIPDGILNYVPFELLKKEDTYFFTNTTVAYAPGLSYISQEITPKLGEGKVAFFAPSYSKYVPNNNQLAVRGEAYDLKGAKEEVKELSKLVSSITFEGEEASKENFENLPNDISILHLSMHSYLNNNDSELSSLVFTDSNDDYQLYMTELYGLNFNANLAVLSACNTGVGGIDEGEGLVSLSRAFTFAGVPATVSSLWSAPDLSTKEIMISFYKNLKEGQLKSEALQNAKLQYLTNTTDQTLQHPYYWAGFVMHGDDQPITIKSNSNYLWWIAGGLLLVLIGGVIVYKRSAKAT